MHAVHTVSPSDLKQNIKYSLQKKIAPSGWKVKLNQNKEFDIRRTKFHFIGIFHASVF